MVRMGRESVFGLLRAVTPTDRLVVSSERGVETLIELSDAKSIEDARHKCSVCGALVNRIFGDPEEQRCADCERAYAARQPLPSEQCEEDPDCTERAFYSPLAKKFRCAQHHAKAGTLTGIGAEARVLHESRTAICRSDDIDSLRHDWKRSKSSFHCRLCYVKVFTKPAGYRG